MQAVWKGSVAFGLVNIPVKLYVATESHDISFRQVHAEDGGRIQYKKTCSVCGRVLSAAEISRAYETEDGELLVMDDADFADLPVRTTREIEVLEFVPTEQVDPILFERSYLLEPEERAAKSYVLLREALQQTDRLAIVMVTLRQKTHLGALRVSNGALVVQTMLWPDEVRTAAFPALDEQVEVRKPELAMAASLVESMAADFDPQQYHDEYRDALMAVIDAKRTGGKVLEQPAPAEEPTEVLDLMAALEASVARARARAGTSVKAVTDQAPPAEPKAEKAKPRKAAPAAERPRKAPARTTTPKAAKATKTAKAADKEPATRSRRSA